MAHGYGISLVTSDVIGITVSSQQTRKYARVEVKAPSAETSNTVVYAKAVLGPTALNALRAVGSREDAIQD